MRTKPTPDALFALRRAMDESPLRLTLPPEGRQDCPPESFGPGLVYSRRGRIVESLCNGDVVLLNARTGRAETRRHVARSAPAVELSADGTQLGVATEDGIALLDPATARAAGGCRAGEPSSASRSVLTDRSLRAPRRRG